MQRIPEMMELEKTENDRVKDILQICFKFPQRYRSVFLRFPSFSLQIVQLKLQIEVEMQKNKKSKDKLTALREDIEKAVSIVTFITLALSAYVCPDSSFGRAQ